MNKYFEVLLKFFRFIKYSPQKELWENAKLISFINKDHNIVQATIYIDKFIDIEELNKIINLSKSVKYNKLDINLKIFVTVSDDDEFKYIEKFIFNNKIDQNNYKIYKDSFKIDFKQSNDFNNVKKYYEFIKDNFSIKNNKLKILMQEAYTDFSKEKNSIINKSLEKIKKESIKEKTTHENQITKSLDEAKIKSLDDCLEDHSKNQKTIFDMISEGELVSTPRISKGAKAYVIKFDLKSRKNVLSCQMFLSKEKEDIVKSITHVLSSNKPIAVKGTYKYVKNNWEDGWKLHDLKNIWNSSGKTLKKMNRVDNQKEKRVELNLHTKMSALDGITSGEEYVNSLKSMGHKGFAITDFNSVQSFPEIYLANEKLKNKLKIAYGVSLELISEKANVVTNWPTNTTLDEYVVFDLETTGLSSFYHEIIEFGAIKIKNGKITDKIQSFIRPTKRIPEFISNLTGITEKDVENAPSISESIPLIKSFIKDIPMVAHNAFSFDAKFLKQKFSENGHKFLNPILDTMLLAIKYQNIFKLKKFSLKDLAKMASVNYDSSGSAHRADYDANVLDQVFKYLLEKLESNNIYIKNILDCEYDRESNRDLYVRRFGNKINIIAKNQKGLNDIYQLVSKASIDYFYGKPKIFKKEIEKKADNLIISPSGTSSEIIDLFLSCSNNNIDKNNFDLYDYIEILPPSCLTEFIYKGYFSNNDELNDFVSRIVDYFANKKPLIATSNSYYLESSEKEFRKVLVNTKGIGGRYHRLYRYFKDKQDIPNNHVRTTREMLDELSFLNKDELIKEIVIDNPNKILNSISDLLPLQKGTFFATISEDAQKILKQLVNEKLNKKYLHNNHIPVEIISRVKKELDSIIKNNFSNIYLIAHEVVKKSLNDGYLVGSRGSVGSSLIATLLEITEVNPLKAHYLCNKCNYSSFEVDKKYKSGYDLPKLKCPSCGAIMTGDGHNIPFETFLGFEGDKVPDIDLNFASNYQPIAHNFLKELFGEDKVIRAGTISTIANKTAYALVKKYEEENNLNIGNKLQIYVEKLIGVKRTTGQHPGGIIIIPKEKNIYDFTPVNYPADDINSEWKTSHFAYESLHDNLLKLDLLGHADPLALRKLQNITGIDPKDIPFNDKNINLLFSSPKSLNFINEEFEKEYYNGALGIPEFGTPFVRRMLKDASPESFADLVQISGLSHGTDVWVGNAQDLISKNNLKLEEVIGCRDDIMTFLFSNGIDSKISFKIMESVRKGKGIPEEYLGVLKDNNIPEWYIKSCNKISYMFPKAHATAYVIMAWRIAWFKVYKPLEYYSIYFSTRCTDFNPAILPLGIEALEKERNRLKSIPARDKKPKDDSLKLSNDSALEMARRGFKFLPISANKSHSTEFIIENNSLRIPFISLPGLGINVAENILEERNKNGIYLSYDDFASRSKVNKTQLKALKALDII